MCTYSVFWLVCVPVCDCYLRAAHPYTYTNSMCTYIVQPLEVRALNSVFQNKNFQVCYVPCIKNSLFYVSLSYCRPVYSWLGYIPTYIVYWIFKYSTFSFGCHDSSPIHFCHMSFIYSVIRFRSNDPVFILWFVLFPIIR